MHSNKKGNQEFKKKKKKNKSEQHNMHCAIRLRLAQAHSCSAGRIALCNSFLKICFQFHFSLLPASFFHWASAFFSLATDTRNGIYFSKNNYFILQLAWFLSAYPYSIRIQSNPIHSSIQFIGIFNCFLSPIWCHRRQFLPIAQICQSFFITCSALT